MRHRDSLPGVEGDDLAALKKGVHHPVVIAHPETGAKSIYVNPGFTVSIDNVSSEESTEILEFLFAHYTQPKFVYSHYYKDGDLVMWDNRGEVSGYNGQLTHYFLIAGVFHCTFTAVFNNLSRFGKCGHTQL